MAQYSRTVLTDAGVILARRMMDETITMEFTRIVTGDGQYSSGEDIAARTALKSQKQSFPLSSRSLTDEDRVLHLKYVISNVNPDSSPLTVGYYVREVGIYAHVTGESEILYAVAIADADAADYLPEYDELQPSTITMDWFVTVGNTENITIQASPSAYALAEDLEDLAEVVDLKLDADGDSKNNTISFTSSDEADSDVTKNTGWATVAPLASGETHESFMTKFSKIVKNLRWLYKLMGTTDISSIGDGTVTKALSVLNANGTWKKTTCSEFNSEIDPLSNVVHYNNDLCIVMVKVKPSVASVGSGFLKLPFSVESTETFDNFGSITFVGYESLGKLPCGVTNTGIVLLRHSPGTNIWAWFFAIYRRRREF